MPDACRDRVERALGVPIASIRRLSGGGVSEVVLIELSDRTRIVAKVGDPAGPALTAEAHTLRWLQDHTDLPVPRVLRCEPGVLVLEHIDGESRFDDEAQRDAARLLAGLHGVTAGHFGFDFPTPLGGLIQPNPATRTWRGFFRDHRLMWIAEDAAAAGRIAPDTLARLRRLAPRLEEIIDEPERPALLHGDVWTGNVLAAGGRIRAFLDPAAYFGHPEAELAFITLFSTFGRPFFERYHALRPIRAGFFERRRDVYNLVPLLVHARLFGGGYESRVRNTVDALLASAG